MKKIVSSGIVLFLGFSSQAFAGAGYANDGLLFTLVLICILALLAGFIEGVNYIQKNGKRLSHRFVEYLKERVHYLRDFFEKDKYEYSNISFLKE